MRNLAAPLKYFLKVFLITGLGFAGIMSILSLGEFQQDYLVRFLLHFLFFGLAMGLFSLTFQLQGIPKAKGEKYEDSDFSVTQKACVNFTGDLQVIANKLDDHWKYKNVQLNVLKNELTANVSISWQSFGEKIKISHISNEEVLIVAKNIFATTLLDYGKNKRHVQYLRELIQGLEEE